MINQVAQKQIAENAKNTAVADYSNSPLREICEFTDNLEDKKYTIYTETNPEISKISLLRELTTNGIENYYYTLDFQNFDTKNFENPMVKIDCELKLISGKENGKVYGVHGFPSIEAKLEEHEWKVWTVDGVKHRENAPAEILTIPNHEKPNECHYYYENGNFKYSVYKEIPSIFIIKNKENEDEEERPQFISEYSIDYVLKIEEEIDSQKNENQTDYEKTSGIPSDSILTATFDEMGTYLQTYEENPSLVYQIGNVIHILRHTEGFLNNTKNFPAYTRVEDGEVTKTEDWQMGVKLDEASSY
jgi:hypothetical protein